MVHASLLDGNACAPEAAAKIRISLQPVRPNGNRDQENWGGGAELGIITGKVQKASCLQFSNVLFFVELRF